MDHGKLPLIPVLLSGLWSILLECFRPILRLLSSKFNERELAVDKQWQTLLRQTHSPSLWIHAASLGEFEQARPIIEQIKQIYPEYDITLTFTSPSGYRIRNNYECVNRVLYLPLDTKKNSERFLDSINPDCIMIIRYELWLNYLLSARKRAIPVYSVNATYPSSQLWNVFPWMLRPLLTLFSEIYTVGEVQTQKFLKLNPALNIVTGSDTRIDRIYKQVETIKQSTVLIQEMIPMHIDEDDRCIVLGSSWQEDEEMFIQALLHVPDSIRLIIVPHEPDEETIDRLLRTVPDSALLSELPDIQSRHIIVDSIGKLLAIYARANAAYIGGGFGAGVHSCAEPAGYGIPLSCGPFIQRSPDAISLHECGALEILRNTDDVVIWIRAVSAGIMQQAGKSAGEYISSAQGMTSTVLREILGIDQE